MERQPSREELDDPQNPNHPMVTPHRADLPEENDEYAEGQRIHDDEIAEMKRGERQVNGPEDRTETGSPSDGADANEGKVVGGDAHNG